MLPDIYIQLYSQFGYQRERVHQSQVLGTGSYGRVVRAILDDLPFAAKILHQIIMRSNDPGAHDFAARYDQECRLLWELKHPWIVQFLGLVETLRTIQPILLMELMYSREPDQLPGERSHPPTAFLPAGERHPQYLPCLSLPPHEKSDSS